VRVRVNGQDRDLGPGTRLVDLLDEMHLDRRFLVIEYNGEPLGRDRVDSIELAEGDRLEFVRPVAGG
jgi:sulfur carrier protein